MNSNLRDRRRTTSGKRRSGSAKGGKTEQKRAGAPRWARGDGPKELGTKSQGLASSQREVEDGVSAAVVKVVIRGQHILTALVGTQSDLRSGFSRCESLEGMSELITRDKAGNSTKGEVLAAHR